MPKSNQIASLAAMLLLFACAGNPSPAAAPGVTPVPQRSQPSVSEGAAAPGPEIPSDARVIELGRRYFELLQARDHDQVWSNLTPEARARFASVAEFGSWTESVLDSLGSEVGVIREAVELPRPGMLADRLYFRVSRYAGAGATPVRLLIGMKNDGSIVGMQVRRAE